MATPHLLLKNSNFLHAVLYHLDTAYPNLPRHEVEVCKNHHRLIYMLDTTSVSAGAGGCSDQAGDSSQ